MSLSKKKKTIAVLRGGNTDHHRSMKSGANIIVSLGKYNDLINVIDVVIDAEDNWFEKGIPSDPHRVFSKADFYIDLTNNKNSDYHNLASKLEVKPVFKNEFASTLSRVNIKRILNQLDIDTPRYVVMRDKNNLEHKLKDIWSRFHTPIIIKDADHHFNSKSLMTHSFVEALKKAKQILDRGCDVIVEEHAHGKYISVAAVPDYRGENLYIPTPAEIINIDMKYRAVGDKVLHDKFLLDHSHDKRSITYLDDNLKREVRKLVEEIYNSLFLDYHTLIDLVLIEDKNKKDKHHYMIKVLELHTMPHLFEDSRFDFIMKNSGVDIGKLILDRVQKLEEEALVY